VATKIGGANSSPVQVGTGKAAGRTAVSGTTAPSSASQSDSTESIGSARISGSARQLAELEQSLQALPAVDEARVSEVRLALDNGTYTVDSGRVADQLLQMERDLGRVQSDK
jgi:negative regulator of flagellin synthesis FlgM